MTHWKKHFNYKYTGAYEMQVGEEKTLTFKNTKNELVKNERGEDNECFVGYFLESEKPLILNKVNCKSISKLYGPEVENWIGKQVIFYVRMEKSFGELIDVLRVKPIKPQATSVDYTAQNEKLKSCTDLQELQKVYSAFTSAEKSATLLTKNEMKSKLTKP